VDNIQWDQIGYRADKFKRFFYRNMLKMLTNSSDSELDLRILVTWP
jgi:hypothetical protein